MFTEEQALMKMESAKTLAQDEMSGNEKELVCQMLTSQPLLKLLGQLWLMGAGQNIHQLDLMTPEGIAQACKVQGKAEGLVHAFELIFSAVTEEISLDMSHDLPSAQQAAAERATNGAM